MGRIGRAFSHIAKIVVIVFTAKKLFGLLKEEKHKVKKHGKSHK